MKKILIALTLFIACANAGFTQNKQAAQQNPTWQDPQGWSLDLGGQYTWMNFTTPPTFSGNTGGVMGKVTYQRPWDFYGQFRTIYNIGRLTSSVNSGKIYEWYNEGVVGYCFPYCTHWTVTPYAGVGIECLQDNNTAYSTYTSIQLKYRVYYAIAGFDTRYMWRNFYLGLQAECLPTFSQYLSIGGLPGAAWTMKQKVGGAVRIPFGIKVSNSVWLELTPYWRLLPIGSSSVLSLPERILNEWGGFAAFRFYL